MKQQDLAEMYVWFKKYVYSFYNEDKDIQAHIIMKEEHTARVAKIAAELAQALQLTEQDKLLAELIGLCHDVGRFKQYTMYRTFNDKRSVDHAQLGLAELQGVQELLKLKQEERDCLYFAIGNHNVRNVQDIGSKREKLHAAIIRDSDKLDIYYVLRPFLNYSPLQKLSPAFLEDLQFGRQSDYTNMKNPDDHKLIRLNWIYDVNFPWTMRQITTCGYVDEIIAQIEPSPVIAKIHAHLLTYMQAKSQVVAKGSCK